MTKLNKSNFSFTKNIVTTIVVPAICLLLAVVFAFVIGINKGLDANGGLQVSVVAENINLQDGEKYSEFKTRVDNVLIQNGVSGSVYLVETEATTYNNVLVVKIDYNNTDNQKTEKLCLDISSSLKAEFYNLTSDEEIQLRNLISVSTFGPSMDSWIVISSMLSTLIALLAICVYIGARGGLYSAVLSFVSSVLSCVLALCLIIVTRIQFSTFTLAVFPLISLISALCAYLFVNSAKNKLKTTTQFERESNYKLADSIVKNNFNKKITIVGFVAFAFVLFALFNIFSPALHYGLALFVATVSTMYTNIFIIPSIFAVTFVRKVKKSKVKKIEKKEALSDDIYNETDLDNLVSN